VCKLASDSPCSLFVDGVREIAPLILDQRQDDPNGTVAQGPSNQFGPVFNVTDLPINVKSVKFKFKRAGTSTGQQLSRPVR
jgi:hypothetical protein